MEFSRQECYSGLPFPSPGDLPDPRIEPRSPTLEADALTSEPPGKSLLYPSNNYLAQMPPVPRLRNLALAGGATGKEAESEGWSGERLVRAALGNK